MRTSGALAIAVLAIGGVLPAHPVSTPPIARTAIASAPEVRIVAPFHRARSP